MLSGFSNWLRRRRRRDAVVLGAQLAEAERAEKRHRRRAGATASPLAGAEYSPSEVSLDRFQSSDTDDRIRRFVVEYRELGPAGRADTRDAMTMDDFYVLLMFARRSTVAALRAGDPAILRDGAHAIAAIDQRRIDPRDLTWAAGLVSWACSRLGLDPQATLLEAADLAASDTAETLTEFAGHPTADLSDWGYRLVQRDDGSALVQDGGNHYDPSVDLLAVATAVAAVFERDSYERAEVTVASDLPDVWLRGGDPDAVGQALAAVRAGASVKLSLRRDAHPRPADQMLVAFVVEVDDDGSADVLAASASDPHGDALGVASGRLCCVVIARSVVAGTKGFERRGALERFRDPIRRELELAQ